MISSSQVGLVFTDSFGFIILGMIKEDTRGSSCQVWFQGIHRIHYPKFGLVAENPRGSVSQVWFDVGGSTWSSQVWFCF